MDIKLPKITRTKVIEGVTIPGIIKNVNYYFVDLEVYEDGRVDCWNFKDFEHFKNNVKSGWVSVSIPDGNEISIHGLGDWGITDSSWIHSKESFIDNVWSIVQYLNPKLLNLYNYVEQKVNGVIIGESGNGEIYKEIERHPNDIFPNKIKGKGINLFFQDEKDETYLVRLDVYDSNSIIVNRYSESFEIDLAQLEQMILDEKIFTEVPIGSEVQIHGLGNFTIKELGYCSEISEKLLEIKDIISVLNGLQSSLDHCRNIYEQYLVEPTESLREQLKIAYENVPKHERMFVGDMDTKDIAVRMIIYGEKEIESWSHYQVAKKMGEELPTIKIPKPKMDN